MTLDPRKTALLVIDVKNEYFDGKWPVPDGPQALEQIERAIDASQRANAAVAYVQHAQIESTDGVVKHMPVQVTILTSKPYEVFGGSNRRTAP